MRFCAVIAAFLCAIVALNVFAYPTLKWTGSAGDNKWTTASNWEVVGGGSPAPGTSGTNNYLFVDVPNNTEITIDSSIIINDITITNSNSAVTNTLKISSAKDKNIKNFSTAVFTVNTNCVFNFNCYGPNPWSSSFNVFTLKGGGVIKMTKTRETWGGVIKVYSSTLSLETTGSGTESGAGTLGVKLMDDDAVLNIECDTYVKDLMFESGKHPTVKLNGHKLINVGGTSRNAIEADFLGDLSSTLSLMGPCDWKLLGTKSQHGTYEVRNSKLMFGTDATHPGGIASDATLSMRSCGIAYLFSNTSFGRLAGVGAPTYVSVPSGVTMTLNGTDSATETSFAGRLVGAGNFVKNGSDYKLSMSGSSPGFSGTTTVNAGTLELKRPIDYADDIVAYWSFDGTGDALLTDKIAGVKWSKYTTSGQIAPVKADFSGVYDDSIFFNTNSSVCHAYIDYNVTGYNAWWRTIDPTNFTVSVWLKPANTNRVGNGHFFNMGGWPGTDGALCKYQLLLLQFYKNGTDERIRGYNDNPSITLKKSIVDGNWHHIVCVHELHKISIWIDGELGGAYTDNSHDLYISNNSMQIGGKDGWGRGFCGGMDELIIANGSWTKARIQEEYKRVRRVNEARALPTPAAKWTFDKDLIDEIGGVELVNGGTTTVVPATRTGAYGKCVDLKSADRNFKIKDGDPYPFPSGSQKFTISLRYQIYDAPEYSHTFSLGDTATANKFIGIGFSSACRYNSVNWSRVKESSVSLLITDQNNPGKVDSVVSWAHIVVTYDGTTIKAYRDGAYVTSSAAALNITPNMFNFGDYPNQKDQTTASRRAGSYVDDFRVWTNCCLTADQVALLARSLENGDESGQLTNSVVTVNSGATLRAVGTGNAVKSLSAEGAVEIGLDSSLTAGGGTLSGTISGKGRLTFTSAADLSSANAANFEGDVEVKGGETKLNSSFAKGRVVLKGGSVSGAANDVVVDDGATIVHNADIPKTATIATTGALVLPTNLTITLTGNKPKYGEMVVATGGSLVLPASTDGWTIPSGFKLSTKNNQLRLLKLGTILLVR